MNNKRNVKYVADLIDRDAIAGPSVHLDGVQRYITCIGVKAINVMSSGVLCIPNKDRVVASQPFHGLDAMLNFAAELVWMILAQPNSGGDKLCTYAILCISL
ncbi:hypothetical protein VTP01DRAFT_8356 [Rhizomucor pusillus]|uniref:uncharacterized protein n=1 Tax=Rhizomucor pusillus TaxID=4840 RepID=UPI003742CA68